MSQGTKLRPPTLNGICSRCGAKHTLRLSVWQNARRGFTWPACEQSDCGHNVYPIERRCQRCGAKLRDGNFHSSCALCQRKNAQLN